MTFIRPLIPVIMHLIITLRSGLNILNVALPNIKPEIGSITLTNCECMCNFRVVQLIMKRYTKILSPIMEEVQQLFILIGQGLFLFDLWQKRITKLSIFITNIP